MLDRPIDPGDELGSGDRTIAAGDLDRCEVGIRGDAGEAVTLPGDDPGQVRAVTERVTEDRRRIVLLGAQIDRCDDLAVERFDRRDTGVDHRHADAIARRAERPGAIGADLADHP